MFSTLRQNLRLTVFVLVIACGALEANFGLVANGYLGSAAPCVGCAARGTEMDPNG